MPAARQRLRILDACLKVLEDAHESGQLVVTAELGAKLRGAVRGLVPKMLIRDAIEIIFRQQQSCLDLDSKTASPPPVQTRAVASSDPGAYLSVRRGSVAIRDRFGDAAAAPQPLTEREARALTDLIKTDLKNVCIFLLQARQKRAWSALRFRTWEDYVRCEFGLSRSRSYELLDQARVILVIKDASGMSGIPDISTYAAGQIKRNLNVVVGTIRARMVGESRVAADVVKEVIREERARVAGAGANVRNSPRSMPSVDTVRKPNFGRSNLGNGPDVPVQIRKLGDIVEYLADMPPVTTLIGLLSDDDIPSWERLSKAARWLTEFSRQFHRTTAQPESLSREPQPRDALGTWRQDGEPAGQRGGTLANGFLQSAESLSLHLINEMCVGIASNDATLKS
jgi:hypothetical protein